jgi:hypothetical protein
MENVGSDVMKANFSEANQEIIRQFKVCSTGGWANRERSEKLG